MCWDRPGSVTAVRVEAVALHGGEHAAGAARKVWQVHACQAVDLPLSVLALALLCFGRPLE